MTSPQPQDEEPPFASQMCEFLDPAWYQARYPDIAASKLTPHQHFTRHGATEKRDPNRYFDGDWYLAHYPDVTASGLHPLLHYLRSGAAELRNPHPRFDATYYVGQHPEAAANPLLFHLRAGAQRGYLTERPVEIRDYLPSRLMPATLPPGVFADLVIVVQSGMRETQRCILSVLADRALPLARIIVVNDRSLIPELNDWLLELSREGQIHLIRNRRRLGFAASVNLGIQAAETHDVALLGTGTHAPKGWLGRLAAQAYAQPTIATVSPLFDDPSGHAFPNVATPAHKPDDASPLVIATLKQSTFGPPRPESDPIFDETRVSVDGFCQTTNAGRSLEIAMATSHCMYIRAAALRAVGRFHIGPATAENGFCARSTTAGWRHRLACDVYAYRDAPDGQPAPKLQQTAALPESSIPFRFAVAAAMIRDAQLPVVLMVSHSLGGGVKRHIGSLVDRCRHTANLLLLEGTARGTALSFACLPHRPVLTLPSERLDDLVTVLRSLNVSRVHIHHLLQMDMDIRALVQRLAVPFDLTVHDYYAICPQINLLRWPEGFHCGEPGPAGCNACIADRASHGARDIVSWRRGHAWQFTDADRVICPSDDVKDRLARHGLAEHAIVVPHERQVGPEWFSRPPKTPAQPLRVALLGVLANHKGARSVAEVAEAAEPGTLQLHLVGHLENDFPKPAAKLIKATGKYQDRDLPGLLQRVDPQLLWFPSTWPETYSFTLTTAIATGLPIVASNLGAFPERLTGRPHTWLVDHRATAAEWLAVFETVRADLAHRAAQPSDVRPTFRPPEPSPHFYAGDYLSPKPGAATATRRRKPRIAIVPERHDDGGLTPCAHIRLLSPLDHPSFANAFDIVLADDETIFGCDADIIVTQRHAIPDLGTANRLAAHASRTGARLVFDLDDDLLTIPRTHPDAATLLPMAKVVRRILALADSVWVSTPGLAERLTAIRPDATVIENRLDERIWSHAAASDAAWDDPVRILCMGTSTHDRDFAMIEPALLRLKAEHGNRIAIDVLGMTSRSELPLGLNRIGPSNHASRSYPGFVNWLASVRPRWHIGLAPLLDTAFNRSKSPVKAMDYAALGLAVLASDTPAYRGSIADGPAGQLVANHPQAWHAALDWLIRDHALRQSTATSAHAAFHAHATLASQPNPRRKACEALLNGQPQRRANRRSLAPQPLA